MASGLWPEEDDDDRLARVLLTTLFRYFNIVQ